MFKEWFAQTDWSGLSFLGLAALVTIFILYRFGWTGKDEYGAPKKRQLSGRQATIAALAVLGLFFVLYLFGLRY